MAVVLSSDGLLGVPSVSGGRSLSEGESLGGVDVAQKDWTGSHGKSGLVDLSGLVYLPSCTLKALRLKALCWVYFKKCIVSNKKMILPQVNNKNRLNFQKKYIKYPDSPPKKM